MVVPCLGVLGGTPDTYQPAGLKRGTATSNSTPAGTTSLNSPFAEPARHFLFDDDGITDEILDGRRMRARPVTGLRVNG